MLKSVRIDERGGAYYSDNALAWLNALLNERFGCVLDLVENSSCFIITLPPLKKQITVLKECCFFSRLVTSNVCQSWKNVRHSGWELPLGCDLPAPGAGHLRDPLVVDTGSGFEIGYDLVSLVFWSLNRLEETHASRLDEHLRFPASESYAWQAGYLERPIVDEWLDILRQVMEKTWPSRKFVRPRFSVQLTHDVDSPSRAAFRPLSEFLKSMAADLFLRHDMKRFFQAPWIRFKTTSKLASEDPLNTFDWLMSVAEQRGLRSAFYFICGRTDPSKDAFYEPDHPAIVSLMREIHRRGHEIGLHPSYNTFLDPAALCYEAHRLREICSAEKIGQSIWGGRMHYLRWRHPETLRAWVAAGMNYDASLGYADRPGFRASTCHEYQGFDPVADEVLSVRVRPLVAMECTVIADRYLGLGYSEAALDKFLQLKNACRAVGGTFSLLWHNSELDSVAARRLFLSVLE